MSLFSIPLDQTTAGEPQAFFIAVAGRQAGLALRQGRGFRFVAADPDFQLLDGSRFGSLEQLQDAARRFAKSLRRPRSQVRVAA